MYLAIGLIICLFVIIIIFSFPQFSPIPYFPSNGRDIPLILKALNIRSDQTIIDLGAGDGIVIFRAAERAFQNKCNTKFIAVEINPILLLILHIRRLLHPNRKNIKIINTDMFSINYSLLITNHYPLRPKVWAKGPSPFGGYRPLGEITHVQLEGKKEVSLETFQKAYGSFLNI